MTNVYCFVPYCIMSTASFPLLFFLSHTRSLDVKGAHNSVSSVLPPLAWFVTFGVEDPDYEHKRHKHCNMTVE